jgi:hypothetical protein
VLVNLIVLGLLVWFGYRYHQKQRLKNQRRQAQANGDAGEATVSECLKALLPAMDAGQFVVRHSLILNHAPGTAFPTAEVDHLAVTEYGIFVIETKNWSGKVLPSEGNMLRRIGPDGRAEERKNPAAQNVTKVTFIKSILPQYANRIYGVGVFSHPEVQLDPRLRSDILHVSELGYWLRARRDAHRSRPLDTAEALKTILQHADNAPDAQRRHKARVSATA